jgi:battenin
VLYVIILSAALDLVGPDVPKGIVLLADVVPSLATKLIGPYFMHLVPYGLRILILAALSTCGMLLIALTAASRDSGTITAKMVGVMLASLSSGAGELSFLGLIHYYGHFSLAAWGSGTGAAGLVGAGAYVLATTALGLSERTTLLMFSFLPAFLILSFFAILPRQELSSPQSSRSQYEPLAPEEPSDDEAASMDQGNSALVSSSVHGSHRASTIQEDVWSHFKSNLLRARRLFLP